MTEEDAALDFEAELLAQEAHRGAGSGGDGVDGSDGGVHLVSLPKSKSAFATGVHLVTLPKSESAFATGVNLVTRRCLGTKV